MVVLHGSAFACMYRTRLQDITRWFFSFAADWDVYARFLRHVSFVADDAELHIRLEPSFSDSKQKNSRVFVHVVVFLLCLSKLVAGSLICQFLCFGSLFCRVSIW